MRYAPCDNWLAVTPWDVFAGGGISDSRFGRAESVLPRPTPTDVDSAMAAMAPRAARRSKCRASGACPRASPGGPASEPCELASPCWHRRSAPAWRVEPRADAADGLLGNGRQARP